MAHIDCKQLLANRKAFCSKIWVPGTSYHNRCMDCAASANEKCTGTDPGDFCNCLKQIYLDECSTNPTSALRIACKELLPVFLDNCNHVTDEVPGP